MRSHVGLLFTLTTCIACTRSPAAGTSALTGGTVAGAPGDLAAGSAAAGIYAAIGGAGERGTAVGAGTGGSTTGGSAAAGQAGGAAAGAAGANPAVAGASGTVAAGRGTPLPAANDVMYVPHASWTCGMPRGIPPATGELVFEATLVLKEIRDLGDTKYGRRRQLDIASGAVKGPKIEATILAGGLDYELTLSNGASEIEQINMLRTKDGAVIYFRSCGTSPSSGRAVRMVPDIEAPNGGAYAFLNTTRMVGTREIDAMQRTMKLAVYVPPEPAGGGPFIAVENPSGLPEQSWECKQLSGQRGAEVYKETVGIGSSLAVGASKHGTRNVIPIIGGTTTGRIAGTVLAGGGDYQILGGAIQSDARYTLETSDGELIIVRNCSSGGGLVPVFETKKNGKYAWLNEDRWLSSDPGVAASAINSTMYERR